MDDDTSFDTRSNRVAGVRDNELIPVHERRRHPRAPGRITALVISRHAGAVYAVQDLSVGGVALSGGPHLPIGTICTVVLSMPESDPIRISARIANHRSDDDGFSTMGLDFHHRGDDSEDRIQAVLLAQLERRRTSADELGAN